MPASELVTLSFEVNEDMLDSFEKSRHNAGLSIQNVMHIAILRFIQNLEAFVCKYQLRSLSEADEGVAGWSKRA